MSICPEYCLPLNACTPATMNISSCFFQPCKCLAVRPTPEDLAPTPPCMGLLCIVQAVSSCASTSLNFLASKIVPLPFAYLATHIGNITSCFLLALQIPILDIYGFGFFPFFLTYSISSFLHINLGLGNLSLFQP